ncbi:MAG: DUF222 domain-containing protein [Nocardioides sp.]
MASTVDTTDRGHPISAAVARMRTEIGGVAEQPAWSLGAEETRATVVELTRLAAQVAELELRVVAHAEQIKVGEESGATSTANWLAHQTRLTRREAHARVRLAHSLGAHDAVRADLANGVVLPEQAQVITEALDALPGDLVVAATVELAEKTLLTYAGDHDAKGLRVLGPRSSTWSPPRSARPTPPASSNKKNARPRRPPGSRCRRTATGNAMAGSRSRPCAERC